MKKLNYKKGQTLVEIAIVFGISSIVLVSLVILASSALRQAQESVRRTTSNKIANAGIEAVIYHKNFIGTGETTVFPASAGGINSVKINSTSGTLEADASGNGETVITRDGLSYIRKITITADTVDKFTVTSTVSWNVSSTVINTVEISRLLTKWN